MPRKVIQPERFLLLSDDLSIAAVPESGRQKKKRGPRNRRRSNTSNHPDERATLSPDLMMRTRRLLMAALRVWELKHGINEPL